MRIVTAAVNPVPNMETTVKKSESITSTDFKHELKEKIESKNQETPKDNVYTSVETSAQRSSKTSDRQEGRVEESVKEKNNQKEHIKNEKIEGSTDNDGTNVKINNNLSNLKEVELEKNLLGKRIKKHNAKSSESKVRSKSKKIEPDSENIQVSQLIQPETQNESIKLIKRDLSPSDSESKNEKLVKDIKVKASENSENKQLNVQNLFGEKVEKQSKKVNLSNKKEKKTEDKNIVKVSDLRTKNVDRNPEKKVDKQELVQNQNIAENNLDIDENTEGSTERTIVLGTTEISTEGDGGKSQAPVMKEATTMLKQQLKDFGNNEIVKQSRFILKDNNIGEIKLILKPEALGEVKINLNMSENSLAGQIVVENSSVKEVFQENLNSLSQALEREGFNKADLNLSLSDKGQREEQQQRERNKQYFSERLKRFDDNGQVVRYGLPTAGINLTA